MKKYVWLIITLLALCGAACAQGLDYNSSIDTANTNNYCVLRGDAVYSVHTTSDWGDVNIQSSIVKASIDDINNWQSVYGPVGCNIYYAMGSGRGLLFVEARKKGNVIMSLSFEDGNAREIATFAENAVSFLPAGDKMFFINDKKLNEYDMSTGKKRTLLTSEIDLGDQLEYAYGKLFFTKELYVGKKGSYTGHKSSGIYSLDIVSGAETRYTYCLPYPYIIIGQYLYTYNDGENLPQGTIAVSLNDQSAKKLTDDCLKFFKSDGTYLLESESATLYLLSGGEPRFDPETNGAARLPGDIHNLLGEYCLTLYTSDSGDRYEIAPTSEVYMRYKVNS